MGTRSAQPVLPLWWLLAEQPSLHSRHHIRCVCAQHLGSASVCTKLKCSLENKTPAYLALVLWPVLLQAAERPASSACRPSSPGFATTQLGLEASSHSRVLNKPRLRRKCCAWCLQVALARDITCQCIAAWPLALLVDLLLGWTTN